MVIHPEQLPSPAVSFAVFFAVSFAFLGLIFLIALPSVIRSLRRHLLQSIARVRRSGRALADLRLLEERGDEIEGLCFFPDGEPGFTGGEFDGYDEISEAASGAA